MSKLIIAEKPSVAKSIASALGASSRADGFYEGSGLLVSWCVGTWYPRWMLAAMTSVSRNGAMTIFPFCRSRSAMCWHQARRMLLKISAP